MLTLAAPVTGVIALVVDGATPDLTGLAVVAAGALVVAVAAVMPRTTALRRS